MSTPNMATTHLMEPTDTKDREIVQGRVFHAPRELVWRAWTQAAHVDQWWGPRGFTNKTIEMSVKPGGVWRYTMTHAEYGTFPNRIDYLEVEEPARLVYDHGDDERVHFRVWVTFTAVGDKTEVSMRSVFPTKAARDEVVEKVGAIEGGKQTLDKLGEYLARM